MPTVGDEVPFSEQSNSVSLSLGCELFKQDWRHAQPVLVFLG